MISANSCTRLVALDSSSDLRRQRHELPARCSAAQPGYCFVHARPHRQRPGLDGQPRREGAAMTASRIALALAVSALAGVGIAAAAAPRRARQRRRRRGPDRRAGRRAGRRHLHAPRRRARGPTAARRAAAGRRHVQRHPVRSRAATPSSESDIEGVLEYNAACQWLRAWRDGRDAALALQRAAGGCRDGRPCAARNRASSSTTVAAEAAAGGGETATSMLRRLRRVARPRGRVRQPAGSHAEP